MGKFRKLAVVVEAVAVTAVIAAYGTEMDDLPDWAVKAITEQAIAVDSDAIRIKTLEGVMRGEPGDMLVKGVFGELYPVKPEIFAATYEPYEEPADEPDQEDGGAGEGGAGDQTGGGGGGDPGGDGSSSQAGEGTGSGTETEAA